MQKMNNTTMTGVTQEFGMRDFTKSILNYFAAFSETRFRFNKRLPYEWADDATTLDLSVFPEFEREILSAVANSKPFEFNVGKGQYTVSLDSVDVRKSLLDLVCTELNSDSLEDLILKMKEHLLEELPEDEQEGIGQRALDEGIRQYNLSFRHAVTQRLTELQNAKIEVLRSEYGFVAVPSSTFNPQREVQRLYDDLTNKARNCTDVDGYVNDVTSYLSEQQFDYTIFDLHLNLRRFLQFIGTQTTHIFFHQISTDDTPNYPLFSVEVSGLDKTDSIKIQTVRDVVMINTPAVNSFEFDTVLTTPRACLFEESDSLLSGVERFIQAKFKINDSFILTSHYRPLVGKNLPDVHYRIGIQAVKDENRRILDYSELMTTLDSGGGRKFADMVSRYVGSNVENTSSEVDRKYRESYPHGTSERLVPRHLSIPLQLNDIQRRILTAVENPKNEIIVVDGPPGTGKSYTITALVYLANQLGKSVLVTSHKRQALDVIDQALTEQFKQLHPQAKPSVLRLQKGRGTVGINGIQNTLSSQAVNAARRRAEELRKDAVESDRERTREAVANEYSDFWQQTDTYEERLHLLHEWSIALETLLKDNASNSMSDPRPFPEDSVVKPDSIRHLIDAVTSDGPSLSLESLIALFGVKDQIPDIQKKCNTLNQLNEEIPINFRENITSVSEETAKFHEISLRLTKWTESKSTPRMCDANKLEISDPSDPLCGILITYDDAKTAQSIINQLEDEQSKMLSGILRRKKITALQQKLEKLHPQLANPLTEHDIASITEAIKQRLDNADSIKKNFSFLTNDYVMFGFREYPPEKLQKDLATLASLEFSEVIDTVAAITETPATETTFAELSAASEHMLSLDQYITLSTEVETFATHVNIAVDDLPRLYTTLKDINSALSAIQHEDITALTVLFDCCEDLLNALGIKISDLGTLFRFAKDEERCECLLKFIDLHGQLSSQSTATTPDKKKIDDFFLKTQKLQQRVADDRFANLLHNMGDVARLQTSIEAGRRISIAESSVLFKNLSCIIAEPALISQHFPMEPDMIDLLIIDEASQVSIAESISLMLRAKQTIVFGDELQYGAVGAVNVSRKYSEHYFKDILSSYSKTQNVTIADEESERLAREVSTEPNEEDQESCALIPVTPGTIEWLKTFSVRTSTLTFAKALQNYSASLNTHFRSFPEIISYSNDVFYRPSQIELITNRIRTKPISEVLRFLPVTTKGMSGRNINLDEIEAIQRDIERLIADGYKGTIGVICSFDKQSIRMEEMFRKEMTIHPDLVRNHKFKIWFVGDVQGEERDLFYYSFVQDKQYDNADLRTIYPTIGGTADNIRRLKMQRLNVGFSRAKDIMVFVHSMDIGDYSDTRLGDALRHYEKILSAAHDHYIADEAIFDSPAEKRLYSLIVQTPFFKDNNENVRLIAQFEIGQYIRQEYRRYIPNYRVDFLLTKTDGGKEKSLVIEYDGLEFHTKNPDIVTAQNFDQEYLEYDKERQIELESYGYSFLRINKFSLLPTNDQPTSVAVLDKLLRERMD